MRRHHKESGLDFAIPGGDILGDELEQSRIQLENNLQQTELSLRLSSATDDDDDDLHYRHQHHQAHPNHHHTHQQDDRHARSSHHNHEGLGQRPPRHRSSYGGSGGNRQKHSPHRPNHSYHHSSSSLEYPRHNSEPELFNDFGSFIGRSRDHHDPYDHSIDPHAHGWSYRSADDDLALANGGETLSTAGHHASQLTLSAGLNGRTVRREGSLSSGAEYDPERPVQDMIAGVNSKFSLFDLDSTRSKHSVASGLSMAPVIIDVEDDNTNELDRVLKSGLAPPPTNALNRQTRHRSARSSSSSSDSESISSLAQSANTKANTHANATATAAHNANANPTINRPKLSDAMRRVSFSPNHQRLSGPSAATGDAGKEGKGRYHPTSPLTRHAASRTSGADATKGGKRQSGYAEAKNPLTPTQARFSRTARALARDSENEFEREGRDRDRERNMFHDTQNSPRTLGVSAKQTPRKSNLKNGSRPGYVSKVYLPDVTGLTNVVESPMKFGGEYAGYKGDVGVSRESEVRLVRTLNAVQSKLLRLEEENSISRRKVTELERELDDCKREMVKERLRVDKDESIASIRRADLGIGGSKKSTTNGGKGKGKAVFGREWNEGKSSDRLDEVASEKKALEDLIGELRSHLSRLSIELSSHQQLLTELRRLRDLDVGKLQEKSEDIAHLKSQVEKLEGEVEVLRATVEEGIQRAKDRSAIMGEEERERDAGGLEDALPIIGTGAQQRDHYQDGDRNKESRSEESEDERERRRDDEPPSPRRQFAMDKTTRTDHATFGGDSLAPGEDEDRDLLAGPTRQAQAQAQEAEEDETRQLDNSVLERVSLSLSRSLSVHSSEDTDGDSGADSPTPPPTRIGQGQAHGLRRDRQRSAAPTRNADNGAKASSHRAGDGRTYPVTPFPQIRGKHLEELFFSAPEHNEAACRVCRRGRRNNHGVSDIMDVDGEHKPVNGGALGYGTAQAPVENLNEAVMRLRGLDLGGGNVVLESDSEVSAVGVGKLLPSSRERGYWKALDDAKKDAYQKNQQHKANGAAGPSRKRVKVRETDEDDDEDEGFAEDVEDGAASRRRLPKGKQRQESGGAVAAGLQMEQPPQDMVKNVIDELQDDLVHYKSIFIELADQYKLMDAASDVRRRNVLAQHVKEVIDILEQKANQIAALTKLLSAGDSNLRLGGNTHASGKRPGGLKRHQTYA